MEVYKKTHIETVLLIGPFLSIIVTEFRSTSEKWPFG